MRARAIQTAAVFAAFAVFTTLLSCGGPEPRKPGHKQALSPADQLVDDLANLRFDKLGNPVLQWDAIPPVLAQRERPHKLLVVLVEFNDYKFTRFRGDAGQGEKLANWYQNYLFDSSYRRKDTLSHYYRIQSGGAYHVDGTVLAPITLSKSRAAYGAPTRPVGGAWRNDGDTADVVEEAMKLAVAANPKLNFTDYDRWDPSDFDKDGNLDEADGYLDHFVLVYAGGGQSSCQLLRQIDSTLTPNVQQAQGLAALTPQQRDCADRIWPHRSAIKRREAMGPKVAGAINRRGGVPLSDTLWIRDYNMQSEYTAAATFIHEFGHSIGLPDIYARTSSNSTGIWEVMSSTASPKPQNMSAWSRLMLGWLKPTVIKAPALGGSDRQSLALSALHERKAGVPQAIMAILPPKEITIDLDGLPEHAGKYAMYSGQGNEMNRTLPWQIDMTGVTGDLTLSFDAWWEIEAGWDFAYVETSLDGLTWTRRLPTERKYMPAKHGHDGKGSIPGLTGISGDFDADGKNESNPACDPSVKLKHGEDQAGAEKSACKVPSWVRVAFDISDLKGKKAHLRVRYYTDGAAVERGIMVDNLKIEGTKIAYDFEHDKDVLLFSGTSFVKTTGRHAILVPHYYLLEYRDPYSSGDDLAYNYDETFTKKGFGIYGTGNKDQMQLVNIDPRPGVVLWYYNGQYAWSENDPAMNGPGKGYLLAVDANPNEIKLPFFDKWFQGSVAEQNTHYDVSGADAQAWLGKVRQSTALFARITDYLPPDVKSATAKRKPALWNYQVDGKQLRYGYEIVNEVLPGPARDSFVGVSELVDVKLRNKQLSYRIRDRNLRTYHTFDAPFSAKPFARGIALYSNASGKVTEAGTIAYPPAPEFKDTRNWLNPKLPFGSVAVPNCGFGFRVDDTKTLADGARAKIEVSWMPYASMTCLP